MNKRNTMPLSKSISFNPDNCTGCECCELACSSVHFGVYSNKLSAIRIKANFHLGDREAFLCRQCDSASCVDACRVGAIKFDEETGARYVDQELCVNCGLCLKACPFADELFPYINRGKFEDEDVIIKCDLCHDIEGGPACVSVCPRDALTIVDKK